MQQRQKGIAFMAVSCLLFSTAGLIIKSIPWHPIAITAIRNLFGIATFRLISGPVKFRFDRISLLCVGCSLFTMFGFMVANKLTTAANAILLQSTAPIFVILFSCLLYKARPNKVDIIIGATAFAGILLFFMDGLSGGGLTGNLIALGTGLTYGLSMTINSRPDTDTKSILFMSQILSVFIGLPFALTGGVTTEFMPWVLIVLMGLFQFGIGNAFYSKAIKLAPALDISLTGLIEPLLSPVWVLLFYGERPSLYVLIGGAIVLLSIAIMNIYQSKPRQGGNAC